MQKEVFIRLSWLQNSARVPSPRGWLYPNWSCDGWRYVYFGFYWCRGHLSSL